MKSLYAAFALLSLAATASAVTFNITVDQLSTSSGVAANETTLALIVVDTTGNGFASILEGSSLLLSSFLNGGDDFIAFKGNLTASGFGDGVFQASFAPTLGTATVPANSNFALLWFPGLTTSSASAISGQSYGLYTSAVANQFGSTSAWNVGANNSGSFTINAYSTNNTNNLVANPLTGGLPNTALRATLSVAGTAIPEPSTWAAMLGFAAIGFAFWKRSKK